jgi:hypothetical protein
MASLLRGSVLVALTLLVCANASAANQSVTTTLRYLSVNGGADTANPGVTCLLVDGWVSPSCPSGWIAIRNNNKELLAAALQVKATRASFTLHYDDAGGPFHCPFLVFTPCSVNSIVY